MEQAHNPKVVGSSPTPATKNSLSLAVSVLALAKTEAYSYKFELFSFFCPVWKIKYVC